MRRVVSYFVIGLFFMLFQTVLFPKVFPLYLKPNLLLVLVVYLGVNERFGPGGILAYTFGCLLDVFAGSHFGMYGMTFLVIFFSVRGAVSFFNPENPLLLIFMVFCGTLMEAAMLILLGFLARVGGLWLIVAHWIVPQLILNLLIAYLLLFVLTRVQRRWPRLEIPGMKRLSESYES